MSNSNLKIGIYVDVANIVKNGGYGMQFDVLREFACRDGAEPLRMNAYVSYDEDRAKDDWEYRNKTQGYFAALRELGYKLIQKTVRWYTDDSGNRFGKANSDLDMAVDALLQSENLDRVLMVTGDGDFIQVVRALQNKGCRVEVLAFDNISQDLTREADLFISGYLVPGLLPIRNPDSRSQWGEVESRVRGYCYHYDHAKGYGFMRFLSGIKSGLWITDTRNPDSPYLTAFCHETQLPNGFDVKQLPSRRHVFEFTLRDSGPDRDPQAQDVKLMGVGRSTGGYSPNSHGLQGGVGVPGNRVESTTEVMVDDSADEIDDDNIGNTI